ncbi:MAG: hypothetical protein M3511_07310 [Deinococcota bacterium]|nr:hypothetical protein [Deinococcota bacterium]
MRRRARRSSALPRGDGADGGARSPPRGNGRLSATRRGQAEAAEDVGELWKLSPDARRRFAVVSRAETQRIHTLRSIIFL